VCLGAVLSGIGRLGLGEHAGHLGFEIGPTPGGVHRRLRGDLRAIQRDYPESYQARGLA